MQKIAIIGAGISGLTAAHFLKNHYEVTIFEKEDSPGGLIRCNRINGCLFHTCGGHVFNSRHQDVLDWFWSKFNREREFSKTTRNSCVFLDKNNNSLQYDSIPYPIENHMYLFSENIQESFYDDLKEIDKQKGFHARFTDYENFGDFLRWRFGKTLYDMYFEPYNKKVWRRNLNTVPMSWMEGKLPMPTTQEMRNNNANKVKEKSFVHSSFWYENTNGSQYIADKLAKGLNIVYNVNIKTIKKTKEKWVICDKEFDKVLFCGNIKDLVKAIKGVDVNNYLTDIENLEYHGTTAVFCEIDANPYSWIYMPSQHHESHRIICTGNFANTNNANIPEGRITATIEFTDAICLEDIIDNLKRIPLHPKYLSHKYNQYTYPIQNANTRAMIKQIKANLAQEKLFFTGRFADWEYYNMDVAMKAAIDVCQTLL